MRRSSNSGNAFKREKLYIGIPKNAFYLLLLVVIVCMVIKSYVLLPGLAILWWIFRWATIKDTNWISQIETYSKEENIYDTLPRKSVTEKIAKGWGKGIPW